MEQALPIEQKIMTGSNTPWAKRPAMHQVAGVEHTLGSNAPGMLKKAIEQKIISNYCPIISLACAHPAKFPQVIKKSIGVIPEFPLHLDQIMSRKENFKTIDPNLKDVQEYIIKSMRIL